MITFALGVSATIVVGILIWLTVDTIKVIKKVKSLETEKQGLWMEIERRCDSIERDLHLISDEIHRRIDNNASYVDSRVDKVINHIEREYVTKKNRLENTIDYNN